MLVPYSPTFNLSSTTNVPSILWGGGASSYAENLNPSTTPNVEPFVSAQIGSVWIQRSTACVGNVATKTAKWWVKIGQTGSNDPCGAQGACTDWAPMQFGDTSTGNCPPVAASAPWNCLPQGSLHIQRISNNDSVLWVKTGTGTGVWNRIDRRNRLTSSQTLTQLYAAPGGTNCNCTEGTTPQQTSPCCAPIGTIFEQTNALGAVVGTFMKVRNSNPCVPGDWVSVRGIQINSGEGLPNGGTAPLSTASLGSFYFRTDCPGIFIKTTENGNNADWISTAQNCVKVDPSSTSELNPPNAATECNEPVGTVYVRGTSACRRTWVKVASNCNAQDFVQTGWPKNEGAKFQVQAIPLAANARVILPNMGTVIVDTTGALGTPSVPVNTPNVTKVCAGCTLSIGFSATITGLPAGQNAHLTMFRGNLPIATESVVSQGPNEAVILYVTALQQDPGVATGTSWTAAVRTSAPSTLTVAAAEYSTARCA